MVLLLFWSFSGFSTPLDVNFKLCHLQSRLLREFDFAKFYHYGLTGLYDQIKQVKKEGGNAFQGASLIKFYKNFKIFTIYKIENQIVSWDETSIYLQQTLKAFDGSICFSVLSKQRFTKVNVVDLMENLTNEKPQQTKELKFWMKSMKLSSLKLRVQ
jgi:hypothetical protein